FVAVCIHWGDEYRLLPNKSQRSLADWLMKQDIDMVIGGHPHVIQPMEMRTDSLGRKRLLVYSMGNFISNMKTVDTRGGAVVNVSLRRDILGRPRIDCASYRLVFTVPPTREVNNFRVVPVEDCNDSEWGSRCRAFVKSAEAVFGRHNVDVTRDTTLMMDYIERQ
ncbi:MAG: CapA family protein, partial [Muribaculaceae bacterium]|nr:CapA family protein [Muribaculaceae bacterium]